MQNNQASRRNTALLTAGPPVASSGAVPDAENSERDLRDRAEPAAAHDEAAAPLPTGPGEPYTFSGFVEATPGRRHLQAAELRTSCTVQSKAATKNAVNQSLALTDTGVLFHAHCVVSYAASAGQQPTTADENKQYIPAP